jgi:hypothetical protein
VLSAYSADAQIPVLTDFDKKGVDSEMTIGHIEGPITWKSYSAVEHNSPAVEKRIMEGIVKVKYKIWALSTTISIGVRTKVDAANNIVESIIYSQGEEDIKITPYEKMLAARQGIDTTELSSLTYEIFDYNRMKITNQETGADTVLEPGVMDLHTTFASLLKNPPAKDTVRSVWYRGKKYQINVSVKVYPNFIETHGDLYTPSAKNPDKKDWIFPVIESLDIRTDIKGRPYYIKAEGKFIWDIDGSIRLVDE